MKTSRGLFLFVFIFLFLPSLSAYAQQADSSSFITLQRIYHTRAFASQRFGPARWLGDGSGYTTLEPSKTVKGGTDIIKYDAATGKRSILVPAEKLIPAGRKKPLEIDNYEWSANRRELLIFTNTKKVWRYHTRGDYWVLNLETDNLFQLGGDAPPSTLMFATFSPDGSKVAYVVKHNLYVQDLSSHKITQLTFDGSPTMINGTSDWVYEEELDIRNGFRWSPDSKHIAYWHLNADSVGVFLLINDTDSLYSFTKPVRYPKVGTDNSAAKVGVVSANGGKTTWMKIPGNPRNNYIVRMYWDPDSKHVVVEHMNRLQNRNQVLLCDAASGNIRTVFTDSDKAWVDVNDDFHWLKDGKHFTWVSERDGWRHVYIVSVNDGSLKLVTPGNFDVINVESIDQDHGWIYFIASPHNATQRYLYRMPLNGSGKLERITPQNEPGTHSYQISPNSEWAIHRYSSFDTPPIVNLVHLPDHKVYQTLVANTKLKATLDKLKRKPVEFFKVNIGNGVKLDGFCIKPYNFSPHKKYPVLFYVYGEPAGQTVLDRWMGNTYLWHEMLAQEGYIIMSVDNRGTPAPKGRAWRKSIYRQIGILAPKDQANALKALEKARPYMDSHRIAIWGWSGGGSMTLNMLFRYPDLYQTGMSIAPVTNQRNYDTIYQERYMGLPKDNPEGYKYGSPITYAQNLKGNLLIVAGSGDDNVHYQNTEQLVNKLISLDKPFRMMVYPNRTHSIYLGKNTRLHLFSLLTRYLNEHCPPGTKPIK